MSGPAILLWFNFLSMGGDGVTVVVGVNAEWQARGEVSHWKAGDDQAEWKAGKERATWKAGE